MQKSSFFNSSGGDRRYKAEDWAEYFFSFIGNGVFPNPSTGLQVVEGQGMTVNIKAGRGWISGYFFHNTTDHTETLAHADGALRRIDRIVLRWSLSDRNITIQVKKGNTTSNPVPPDITRNADIYELALADITVNAGATFITQANITDQRLNKTLCGIVAGTVEEVDTTTIFNQYQSWFDTFTAEETAAFNAWFATIQDILDENVAAELLAMIQTKQDKITASGLLKGDGAGGVTAAVAGTDYATPSALNAKQNTITATGLLKGSGGGNVSAAVANTDYATPSYVSTTATNVANTAINAKIIIQSSTPAVVNGAIWIKY